MDMWGIDASVRVQTKHGWVIRYFPTFFLSANQLGILRAEDAAEHARRILGDHGGVITLSIHRMTEDEFGCMEWSDWAEIKLENTK